MDKRGGTARRSPRFSVLLALTSFLVALIAVQVPVPPAPASASGSGSSQESLDVRSNPETGTPAFVRVKGGPVRGGDPVEVARQFLAAHARSFAVGDPGRAFTALRVQRDKLGSVQVRFSQKVGDVPIYGAQLIVHMRREAGGYVVTSVNGRTYPEIRVPMRPVTTADWATRFAKLTIGKGQVHGDPELVVLPSAGAFNLTWHVTLELENERSRLEVFVNAIRPEILLTFDSIPKGHGATTGTGTGVNGVSRSLNAHHHSNNLFYLWDTTRPIYHPTGPFTPTFTLGQALDEGVIATYEWTGSAFALVSDPDNSWGDPSAVDAHFHAGVTEAFYRTKLGRSSIDDGVLVPGGMSFVNVVHDPDDCNASWFIFWMFLGDGGDCDANGSQDFKPFSGALDVVAHELTHGVTQFSADLIYLNQSGAMNESFSDYFGNAIENSFTGRTDGRLGEDICSPGGSVCTEAGGTALRDMNNGKTMDDWSFEAEFSDNGGVHINSDIYNDTLWNIRDRFIAGSGAAGADLADRVMYRALTVYLFPSASFADGRDATVQSARDLGASAAQIQTIEEEFDLHKIGWAFFNAYTPNGFGIAVQFFPQRNPAVDGTRIAWVDDLDGLAHVFDISTGTEEIFGDGIVDSVDISGNRLVWSEFPIGDPNAHFRIRTAILPGGIPQTVSITLIGDHHFMPRIDRNVVVWVVLEGIDFNVLWDDLSTSAQPATLSNRFDWDELFPVVAHDGETPWAAWEVIDYVALDFNIYTRSLPAGTATNRTPTAAFQFNPEISGRNVVYLEDSDLDPFIDSIKRVDASAGDPITIKTTSTDLGPAAIDGSVVGYSEFITLGNSTYDLFQNNLSGTSETAVSTARGWQVFPSISGSRFVWRDTQNFDSDIYSNLAAETVAPTVTAQSPANGATGVAVGTSVMASFSEPMDARSLNGETFTLRREGSASTAPGQVIYDFGARTATFTPFLPLEGGTTYTSAVSSPARDTRGNSLSASVTWSFSTTGPPTSITLDPGADTNKVGTTHTVTATVIDRFGAFVADGTNVSFAASGTGAESPSSGSTNTLGGKASFSFTSTKVGQSTITATSGSVSATATKTWTADVPASITLEPSSDSNLVNTIHTVTATVSDRFGNNVADGTPVNFTPSGTGGESPSSGSANTLGGKASFSFSSSKGGSSTVVAVAGLASGSATKVWTCPSLGAPYFGFDIARDVAFLPGSNCAGYVLEGFGGIHPFGGAPSASGAPYFSGNDIARALVIKDDGTGGFVLDGYGGTHPFGIGGNPPPAKPAGGPYFAGFDIANDILLIGPGQGYILDGFGARHPFGGAPATTGGPYFPGNDIARAFDMTGGAGSPGYVLDGLGGRHSFNGAAASTGGPYFPGFDIARDIVLSGPSQGHVLDGYGSIHPFGGAPAAGGGPYFLGFDIANAFVLDARRGLVLDGFGGLHLVTIG